jgi:hypothetical protein
MKMKLVALIFIQLINELLSNDNQFVSLTTFKVNDKFYLNISLGTPPQNFTALITTNDYYSIIPVNSTKDQSKIYNNKESSTFKTNQIYDYEHYTSGELSYDTLILENDIKINHYGFLLTDNYKPRLSLARGTIKKNKEDFSLIGKLEAGGYITNKNVLIYNDKIYLGAKEMPFNDMNALYQSNCNLFKYDEIYMTRWACNLSHIIYGNDVESFSNNITMGYKAVFDIGKSRIVLPDKAINGKKPWEIIYNSVFEPSSDGHLCTEDVVANYTYIKCQSDLNEEEFIKKIVYKPIYFIFNGYGYTLTKPFTVKDKIYTFNIKWSKDQDEYIIGNSILNNFNAIAFNQTEGKIQFYGNKFNSILNLTQYTQDVDEAEHETVSFFVLSLICVIVLLLLILFIPYFMYRHRKKAMLERLQYDIIYKKLNDITRECAK